MAAGHRAKWRQAVRRVDRGGSYRWDQTMGVETNGVLPEAHVRHRISVTRRKLGLLFLGSIVTLVGGVWVGDAYTSPAADIVFALACTFGGLGSFLFGTFFCVFLGEAKRALRDLPRYQNDPEEFERRYGSVMRIPWK